MQRPGQKILQNSTLLSGLRMDTYKLKVTNNSLNSTAFTLFQKNPEINDSSTHFVLAWLCQFAHIGTTVNFSWERKINAIWCRPDAKLAPGVICDTSEAVDNPIKPIEFITGKTSSQVINMDLDSKNKITLFYDKSNDAYYFDKLENGTHQSVNILCDNSVPNSKDAHKSSVVGVGIGMDGRGLYIMNAQPNFNFNLTTEMNYYLAAGNYKSGEILDINDIMDRAIEIKYDKKLSVSVVLASDNELKIVS